MSGTTLDKALCQYFNDHIWEREEGSGPKIWSVSTFLVCLVRKKNSYNLRKLGIAMVDILVGPSKEVFRVHKEYVDGSPSTRFLLEIFRP